MKTTRAGSIGNVRLGLILLALTFVLHLAAVDASASPLTWTLQGVTFADGAKASGSFTFDATTDTYSGINITTTTGPDFAGATFLADFFSTATQLELVPALSADLTGSPAFLMTFASALTNSGGTIALLPTLSGQNICATATCGHGVGANDFISSGSVTTPEPSTVTLLFVSLLVLAAFFERYRIARSSSAQSYSAKFN